MARRRIAEGPAESALFTHRFTVDASVFVNAFNPREAGHAASLALLTTMHAGADPIIVPSLLLVEVASAVSRATGDGDAALAYATAIAGLPHLTLITVTAPVAREAAVLAAAHRLRGADALYVAVARRYGTVLVTRDREQRTRGAAAVRCRTPEAVFSE